MWVCNRCLKAKRPCVKIVEIDEVETLCFHAFSKDDRGEAADWRQVDMYIQRLGWGFPSWHCIHVREVKRWGGKTQQCRDAFNFSSVSTKLSQVVRQRRNLNPPAKLTTVELILYTLNSLLENVPLNQSPRLQQHARSRRQGHEAKHHQTSLGRRTLPTRNRVRRTLGRRRRRPCADDRRIRLGSARTARTLTLTRTRTLRLAPLILRRTTHDNLVPLTQTLANLEETALFVCIANGGAGQSGAGCGHFARVATVVHVPEGVVVDGFHVADCAAAELAVGADIGHVGVRRGGVGWSGAGAGWEAAPWEHGGYGRWRCEGLR